MRWDGVAKTWKNSDVPDFKWIDPATKVHVGPEESAKAPYLMLPEGKAGLFVPKGLCKEGPFPEHYEALECPYVNPVSPQQCNPVMKIWKSELDKLAEICDPKYPVIATTFRVTEHWQAGALTRNLPWQAELFPEMFVEISPSLAQSKGIKAGDWVKVIQCPGLSDGPGPGHPPGVNLLLWVAGNDEYRGNGGLALALRLCRLNHRWSR